jgi:hypothetical protein
VRDQRRVGAILATAAVLGLLLFGCAGGAGRLGAAGVVQVSDFKSAVVPPPGIVYSDFKAPQRAATAGTLGTRKGTAMVQSIGLPPLPFPGLSTGVNLFSWGDASTEEAKRDGGVSRVTHVDYDFRMILMIYRRYTTEVYGN